MLGTLQSIEIGVGHDAKQPQPQVRALGEGFEVGVRPKHRFLHEILRVYGVGSYSTSAGVELVEKGQSVVDEPYGQVRFA
jgi:hypothetical protein